MDAIMQGTTPSLVIEVDKEDFLFSDVTGIDYRVRTGGRVIRYTMPDLQVDTDANTVTRVFTAEETQSFNMAYPIEVQFRCFFADGSVAAINKLSYKVAEFIGME